MPYPESCPECGSQFRNTGTQFTARRNEVGRHVLLELGCQNTSRRYWWHFSTGKLQEIAQPTPQVAPAAVARVSANGHSAVATLEPPPTASSRAPDAPQQVVPLTIPTRPSMERERSAPPQVTERPAATPAAERTIA